MAIHGRNTTVYVGGVDLSTFFNSAGFSREAEEAEVTTFKSAFKQFVTGFQSGEANLGGFFDADAGTPANDALKVDKVLYDALAGTLIPVSISLPGFALGDAVNILNAVETKYEVSGGVGDAVSVAATLRAADGIQRGVCLYPSTAIIATGNGTNVDNAVSSTNGGIAHLHVFAITGTAAPTITVAIQDSTDGSTGWAAVGTFTARTTVGAPRLVIAGTIRRYVRASWTVSGTTPSLTTAVALARL